MPREGALHIPVILNPYFAAKMCTRSLILIFLFLLAAARIQAAMVTVSVTSGNTFIPAMFSINPGDTVKWVWTGGFHNTSSVALPAGAASWTSNITSIDTAYLYVPTVSGLYNYTCTYHSGMNAQFFVTGCSYPTKPVITSTNGNTACQGDTLHLGIPAQLGATYHWVNGVTTVNFATSNTLDVTTPGAYKVLVNRCGVDSISAPFPVGFNSLPLPSFSYIYTGLSYMFTNTTLAAASCTFVWKMGDGSAEQTTTNAAHTYAAPGAYTVMLKAEDIATHCADSFTTVVQISQHVTNAVNKAYTVFPIPASDKLYIHNAEVVGLYLTDITGRTSAANVQHTGAFWSVDLRALPKGIYLLRFATATGIITEKITVVH